MSIPEIIGDSIGVAVAEPRLVLSAFDRVRVIDRIDGLGAADTYRKFALQVDLCDRLARPAGRVAFAEPDACGAV